MMKTASLKAGIRDKVGTNTARQWRKQGKLPAVLYGHKAAVCALTVDAVEFGLIIKKGSRFVELQLPDRVEQAVIKSLQHDPVSNTLIHVDFARVAMDEVIVVKVPVKLKGHCKGVMHGGALEQHLAEMAVKCLPAAIPGFVEVDITDLEIGSILHVSAVKAPEGSTIAEDPTRVVITVHEPRQEEVVEAAAAAAVPGPTEPEVITAKKEKEEEGEEPAEAGGKKKSEDAQAKKKTEEAPSKKKAD
ncbi:MAG: 50S ribosomal protein L25 [Planctomycetota bacterium]|nr:50S ribosomal protein L25 [Planctomycetota bacterium]